jgi:hypothetical protein
MLGRQLVQVFCGRFFEMSNCPSRSYARFAKPAFPTQELGIQVAVRVGLSEC